MDHAHPLPSGGAPSINFDEFKREFFGDSNRDGPQTWMLTQLTGDEKRVAEQMLLDALGTKDPRPAIGLGELRSRRAAEPLAAKLRTSRGVLRLRIAEALWMIERNAEAADILVGVASGRIPPELRPSDERLLAIALLGGVDTPQSRAALEDALKDADYYIRYNAQESLARLPRLPGPESSETGERP